MPRRCSPRAGDTLFIAKNKHISCSPILVEETHPKSINKEERNNAHSVNCWRGGVIIFSNNYDKIALLWVWAAPYPTLPSASWNIWIIHKWSWFAHKWFLLPHKFWISRHLEMIYWWYSLEILPVTTGVLLVPGLNLSLQWWWIMPEVSLLQWLLQIWFLYPGNSLSASEKKRECCLLLSPTEFNHSTSCGKLTSGHNSQPFRSGQCVITSISLHGNNPRSEGLIVCTVSSP